MQHQRPDRDHAQHHDGQQHENTLRSGSRLRFVRLEKRPPDIVAGPRLPLPLFPALASVVDATLVLVASFGGLVPPPDALLDACLVSSLPAWESIRKLL